MVNSRGVAVDCEVTLVAFCVAIVMSDRFGHGNCVN